MILFMLTLNLNLTVENVIAKDSLNWVSTESELHDLPWRVYFSI